MGKRDGNWFSCTSGTILQADFNSGRNLAIWDYRFCPVDFDERSCARSTRKGTREDKKSVPVIDTGNLQDGVIGSPPNLVNAIQRRVEYIQLSLFDCT